MSSYSGLVSVEGNIIMHASGLSHICAINILHYSYEHNREINIREDGIGKARGIFKGLSMSPVYGIARIMFCLVK